ncbi:hypothetical protein AB0F72_08850 [Actinoplanes sp. NPDC023936]|uniref:hypothetical protein n=1 Tax=Actinoplanes sp. NPDC023936 TaxID=3154910 RepID=UPI0033EEB011
MSITEAFAGVIPAAKPAPAPPVVTPVAEPTATDRTYDADVATESGPSWLGAAGTAVAADFRDAWLWDAEGVTVRALWEQRIPDREQVAAANAGLWAAWCVYNHIALAVITPLLFVAWMLAHPARLLYLTPLAVAGITIWLA